jgi:hypothetical protein
VKNFLGIKIEEGVEIVLISPEDQEEEDEDEREADGKEGGRDEGNVEFSSEEKLEDKERQQTEKADDEAVGYKKEESKLQEEGEVKVKIDVQVGDKKREQEAEEESAEKGVYQNLEEFHEKKLTLFPPPVNVMLTGRVEWNKICRDEKSSHRPDDRFRRG